MICYRIEVGNITSRDLPVLFIFFLFIVHVIVRREIHTYFSIRSKSKHNEMVKVSTMMDDLMFILYSYPLLSAKSRFVLKHTKYWTEL